MLNLLKISDKQLIFFYIRNTRSKIFFKKQKLKKLENFKKFSRISNIAEFFFKCNSEFFNNKYKLINIQFFSFFKKLVNFIENEVIIGKFSKNLSTIQIFIDFSKFLSRKNILFNQFENKKKPLIFLKHLKWLFVLPHSNIFLYSSYLNTQSFNFSLSSDWANLFFRLILVHYYDVSRTNKLYQINLNDNSFKFICIYTRHINYMLVY